SSREELFDADLEIGCNSPKSLVDGGSFFQAVHDFNGFLKLPVYAGPGRIWRKWLRNVRHNTLAFKDCARPGPILNNRQRDPVAVAHFERIRADYPACSFLTQDCGKPVLGSKRSDHLARAGRVLIHQNDDSSVEPLRSQTLRFYGNRFVAQGKLGDQW